MGQRSIFVIACQPRRITPEPSGKVVILLFCPQSRPLVFRPWNSPLLKLSVFPALVSSPLCCCFYLWPLFVLPKCSDRVPKWHALGCGRSPIIIHPHMVQGGIEIRCLGAAAVPLPWLRPLPVVAHAILSPPVTRTSRWRLQNLPRYQSWSTLTR